VLLPRAVEAETAVVIRGLFVQTVDEQAKTRIRDHFVVSSPLAGELERIALREGDDVAEGSIVARLHPVIPTLLDSRTERELRSRLEGTRASKERADARVKQAESALELARREAARSRMLSETNMVARAKLESDELTFQMAGHELDSARADAHVAQHDIDIAAAALARTRDAGDPGRDTEWPLRAPIAGRVLRVQQKSGGTVGVGTPLLEFGDPSNLEVIIELLTTEAPQVIPGADVTLDGWGGETPLMGRVRRIEPWGFTKISALGVEEQRVNVLVDIVTDRNKWAALGEGYRLDAHIRVYQRPDALQIPTGALFRSGPQWMVFSVTADDRARQSKVTIGRRNEMFTEILAGLGPNMRVVLYPSDAVKDGAKVTFISPAKY
jgi:HlyD family secretion protein